MGVVYYMDNYGFGSVIKPNCAANEIPASTSAAIAMVVVIMYLIHSQNVFLLNAINDSK